MVEAGLLLQRKTPRQSQAWTRHESEKETRGHDGTLYTTRPGDTGQSGSGP